MKAKACTTTAPKFWALLVEAKAPMMNPALKTAQEPQRTTLQNLQRHYEGKRT